ADTTGSCNVPYNAADAQHSGGPHTMRAVFTPGTGTWTAATSAADIVNVAGAPTTISIPASTAGNTYNYATPTTLSATVSPAPASPAYTANVQLLANGAPI